MNRRERHQLRRQVADDLAELERGGYIRIIGDRVELTPKGEAALHESDERR